jgi:hypothetical protein
MVRRQLLDIFMQAVAMAWIAIVGANARLLAVDGVAGANAARSAGAHLSPKYLPRYAPSEASEIVLVSYSSKTASQFVSKSKTRFSHSKSVALLYCAEQTFTYICCEAGHHATVLDYCRLL